MTTWHFTFVPPLLGRTDRNSSGQRVALWATLENSGGRGHAPKMPRPPPLPYCYVCLDSRRLWLLGPIRPSPNLQSRWASDETELCVDGVDSEKERVGCELWCPWRVSWWQRTLPQQQHLSMSRRLLSDCQQALQYVQHHLHCTDYYY